jgi:hypothetical protein
MAEQILHVKVKIDPEAINDIKRSLVKDISDAVESAYREGWYDSNSEGMSDVETDWSRSDTKKKLDNLLKS